MLCAAESRKSLAQVQAFLPWIPSGGQGGDPLAAAPEVNPGVGGREGNDPGNVIVASRKCTVDRTRR